VVTNNPDGEGPEPDHHTPSTSDGLDHELDAPPLNRLQEIQERLRRLEEEERVMEQTVALFQRRFGDALHRYPRDVRAYVESRARTKQKPDKHRRKRRRINPPSDGGSSDSEPSSSESSHPESSHTSVVEPRRRGDAPVDYQMMMAQRAKIVEPEPYYGKNLADLRTFRRVCERAFDYKPLAFPVKREKVSWAAMYLRDTPAAEWARYRKDGGTVDIEWDAFITFLTDILMESGNRQRLYTLRYENAKQRQGQSIRTFVEYLESCEEELEPYTETQRAEHLLAKILPEMRQRLVEGGYTRTKLSRADLISVIAMLEQNQSPTSKGTKTDSKDKSKSSSNKKKGSWKNRIQNRDQN
jgi:hypothetical protein